VVGGQAQHGAPCVVGEPAREPEQPVAEPFRLPPSRRVLGQREQLGPGGQVEASATRAHQIWFLAKVVQRQVRQAGVLRAADAVLAACPSAVAQFEVGDLAA
jgi:hypothetical protein